MIYQFDNRDLRSLLNLFSCFYHNVQQKVLYSGWSGWLAVGMSDLKPDAVEHCYIVNTISCWDLGECQQLVLYRLYLSRGKKVVNLKSFHSFIIGVQKKSQNTWVQVSWIFFSLIIICLKLTCQDS